MVGVKNRCLGENFAANGTAVGSDDAVGFVVVGGKIVEVVEVFAVAADETENMVVELDRVRSHSGRTGIRGTMVPRMD